jgi:hypothetical protein
MGGAAVGIGVSVGAGRGVPEAGDGEDEADSAATRPVSAVAVALMLRSSSSMEAVAAGRGVAAAMTLPGKRLAAEEGEAAPDAAAEPAGRGVTCCTATGGPAEKAGLAEPGSWLAGTGVAGTTETGEDVAVGVLPLIVELTI